MGRILTLRQCIVKLLIHDICSQTNVHPHAFLDQLPLPLLIKDKIKVCCTNNAISDIIDRIHICNTWLASRNNYHEDSVRSYLLALEDMRDDLLPHVMRQSGL